MATFKICVFEHQKRRDGKYPVSIRVCWKRKYGYIKTEFYVTDKQVVSKSIKANDEVIKKIFELKDVFILNELNSRIARYDAYSCSNRTPILAENGQQFLRKTDSNSCRKRTWILEENGQPPLMKADGDSC